MVSIGVIMRKLPSTKAFNYTLIARHQKSRVELCSADSGGDLCKREFRAMQCSAVIDKGLIRDTTKGYKVVWNTLTSG
jgi:hypothetical protein